jgi:hypothetical protein
MSFACIATGKPRLVIEGRPALAQPVAQSVGRNHLGTG